MLIGRIDAEAPIVWPPDAKSWLTRKVSDAGKTWRQEEKGVTEDEMVGWHHWLNGHEWANPGRWWRQGSLECCSPWCCKELGTTEWLNNNKVSLNAVSMRSFVFEWISLGHMTPPGPGRFSVLGVWHQHPTRTVQWGCVKSRLTQPFPTGHAHVLFVSHVHYRREKQRLRGLG